MVFSPTVVYKISILCVKRPKNRKINKMASRGELRNMVKAFHTAELESLLNSMDRGHSRNGRSKSDMLKRVLDYIDRGVSSSVEVKIKDLYGKHTSSSSFSSSSHRGSSSSHSRSHSSSSSSLAAATKSHSSVKSSLSVSSSRLSSDMSSVRRSGQGDSLSRRPTASGPVRREVTLKALPFYDVMHEIMKPSSLVPRSTAKQQEVRFNFTLTQQQCDDINNSRTDSQSDCPQFGVQLRFCFADNSSRQPDCFPPGVGVKVNNENAPLPSLIPTNKPGAEPKRPGRPVDITPLCNITPAVVNSIVVSWTVQESRQTHSASVYLVKKLNSQFLLDRLKQNCTRRGDYTKTMIREKMSLDKDTEIATTGMFVSLICPIGKMRMKVPIRTATCDHLQCFDALTFLMMNEKKPTWMCPVCDRPADYFKLIIDGLLCEIINDSPTATEIEMSRDGQWRITQTQDSDDDDDDDDDDFDYPSNEFSQAPEAASEPSVDAAEETTEGVATGCSIDLTESDDERFIGENNSVVAESSAQVSASQRPESHDSDAMSMSPPSSPETAWELLDALPLPVSDVLPLSIPLPSPAMSIPLPSVPPPPNPIPESVSIPLPPAPPVLPHNVGHPSFYPTTKIAISLLSNSSQSTAPSISSANRVSQYTPEAANGITPGHENESMVDFLSIMSGVSGYGAFTMAPNQSLDSIPQPPPPNGR